MNIAIVGNAGSTNVGESLRRAALAAGHSVQFFDAYDASSGSWFLRAVSWRLGHRPPRLNRFADQVVAACMERRPDVLIATGAAPLTRRALRQLRVNGVVCVNYSTDDPWNPTQKSRWHMRALPEYNVVATPRQANLDEFRQLGCGDVRYLPFGYDETLFAAATYSGPPLHDVLFVGGADRDRVEFMHSVIREGLEIALVGGYWDRYPSTRRYSLGQKSPEDLRVLTSAAKVNLCLVRRANRDGHVMRSFEIAAIGGCMLVEDTIEHRAIFGRDGDAVIYFRTAQEAAKRARMLLADPTQRARLAKSARNLIRGGRHSYDDRLASLLATADYLRKSARA
jgi:spore maturation protein CgeB